MPSSTRATVPFGPDPAIARWALAEVRRIVLAGLAGQDAVVLLFGSYATNRADRLSDIDVAVLAEEPLPQGVLAEINERLEESQVPYDVDLVDLAQCDPAFRERVMREGVRWTD